MDSMYQNNVWTLVDSPDGTILVGCKWVFKKKTDMDGNISTYKARLVAKRFTQCQVIDYEQTVSPLTMMKSIRILLAIVAYYNYEMWHKDVKIAFLNRNFQKGVYIKHNRKDSHIKIGRRCVKLNRSINGLNQASRRWNL